MAEDFSGHPKSVSEIRSEKTDSARDWTPRDVLIDALRSIDEGHVDPDALVLIVRPKAKALGTVAHVTYRISSPDYHTTIGMVHSALTRLQD